MGRAVSRLYLDTSTIIYLLEAVSPFHEAAVTAIQRHCGLSTGAGTEILTSRLSRMECRVKPLRQGDQTLLAKYDAFFSQRGLILAEISAAVIEQATEIRVRYRFKTPDAIHLATAIENNIAVFLTGDGELARCTALNVEVVTP